MKKYFLQFKLPDEKSFCTGKIKNTDYNAMVLVVKKWRKPKNANGNGKTKQQIVYYVTEHKALPRHHNILQYHKYMCNSNFFDTMKMCKFSLNS